jgi:hypothetical protein
MNGKPEPGTYKAFDCGRDCHPDRYTEFTTRTRLGRKRWGVRDNHMAMNLSRLCTDTLELYNWLVCLRTMELRERQYTEQQNAPRSR